MTSELASKEEELQFLKTHLAEFQALKKESERIIDTLKAVKAENSLLKKNPQLAIADKEPTEVFDLKCEIEKLKEEATVAENTESELEMTLSELREELVDANAELKAYEEKVEGLEKDGDEDIYGLEGNQMNPDEGLKKTIVNLLSMTQAKTLMPKALIKGCKHRGNCDDEDTVIGRLWGAIGATIDWDEMYEKILEL